MGVRRSAAEERADMIDLAKEAGYSFIELKLLRPAYNGVHGAEAIRPVKHIDHGSGMDQYGFYVETGAMAFLKSPNRSGLFCSIPDTAHNRAFLRNQAEYKWFAIVDKELAVEIMAGKPAPQLPGAIASAADTSALGAQLSEKDRRIAELEDIAREQAMQLGALKTRLGEDGDEGDGDGGGAADAPVNPPPAPAPAPAKKAAAKKANAAANNPLIANGAK